jgi:pre-mRNA-splicing factor CWC22
MIEVIFQVRKDEFRDHEAVVKELDLVEEENQITHLITLDDAKNSEDILSKFSWFTIFTFPNKRY